MAQDTFNSGNGTTSGGADSMAMLDSQITRVDDAVKTLTPRIGEAEQAGRKFGSVMLTAFEGLAIKGKSFSDVLRTLVLGLSHATLKSAFAPLEKGIGSIFSQIVQGGGGLGFAKGGVLQQGTPVPFAKGGVIASPMMFPLSGGGTGLAGEAGAEAILPLARGADGRLGVALQGGRPGPAITFNIQTPDAESFMRSQTQVAAMVARAAALGQRNL